MEAARNVVLVVEDEPHLRVLAMDTCELAGFQVVEAASTAEALEILDERSDIGVVFTDVHFPYGPSGLALAVLVRDRWPSVGIIITSGFERPRPASLPDRSLYYAKPYLPLMVASAIQNFMH